MVLEILTIFQYLLPCQTPILRIEFCICCISILHIKCTYTQIPRSIHFILQHIRLFLHLIVWYICYPNLNTFSLRKCWMNVIIILQKSYSKTAQLLGIFNKTSHKFWLRNSSTLPMAPSKCGMQPSVFCQLGYIIQPAANSFLTRTHT